jgi:hypothetical protein
MAFDQKDAEEDIPACLVSLPYSSDSSLFSLFPQGYSD